MDNINKLNEVIKYIENNITDNIDIKKISQILCVNEYSVYRIFVFITGISLTEYIRNRRLSLAANELLNSDINILDLAIKYNYESSESFSRAFKKFHGENPTIARKQKIFLKDFPPYQFNNSFVFNMDIKYKIIENTPIELFTVSEKISINKIKIKAPEFWNEISLDNNVKNIFDDDLYGIIEYDNLFPNPKSVKYHIASKHKFANSNKFSIPASTWIVFNVDNISGNYRNSQSLYIYSNWIPYSNYNIRNIPEIEVYHKNGLCEWWLPVEKKK